MKAYKVTGKLGDICSFVGGNEVKKGDMVYLHSESDMSIEAMKQALEALEVANSCIDGYYLPKEKAWLPEIEEAITSLRQAIANEALDKMAENERELGIQMKRCECAAHSAVECVCGAWDKPVAKREWVGLTDAEIEEFDYYARDLVMDIEKALKERNNVA
jgi:hypothetical protein